MHGEVQCTIPAVSMHNVMNALAVIATCEILGLEIETIANGIETFKGTHRRFEKLGTLNAKL